ncbi:Histone demethylase UTY [Gossypium australe]|uniref:Histone demethylase UTY n=1 Tax=Gossypium australe TaxID=47621 RepID=A0A5B6X487_9ROSI|nr:Histone demethylase UTY [Gossypium australe]
MCCFTSERHCVSMVEYFDIRELPGNFFKPNSERNNQLEVYRPKTQRVSRVETGSFEDGLNEDIRLLVRILELKEFVVLVDRICKAEELGKEKRKADFEARDSRKISMNKPYQSSSKKS